jgi:hypothetical protein
MEKDVFDYIDEQDATRGSDRSGLIWNLLTILVLLTTFVIAGLFITFFINPNIGINPFPPPTMPVRNELPTPTPTPKSVLPPTWTPEFVPIATQTDLPQPTFTPQPTDDNQGDADEDDDQIIVGDMPVVLQEGSPAYIPSRPFHADLGCNWMGVAGQVYAVNGAPVQGLIVEVGGLLGGKRIGDPTLIQATGLATAYGPGGFEIKLADEPIESSSTLWIQVLDQAGLPLSEKVYFNTFEDCEQNLIIISFNQVK